MNKLLKSIIAFSLIGTFFMSCENEDLVRIPDINQVTGAVTNLTPSDVLSELFWDATAPGGIPDNLVRFTLTTNDFDGLTPIRDVDVEIVWTDANGDLDAEGNEIPFVNDPVLFATLSTFPSEVVITPQEVADLYGVPVTDFEVGDLFRATFPINTEDGRRLTVAVSSDLCQQPAQPSFGGCNFDWAIGCSSAISDIGSPIAMTYTLTTALTTGGADVLGSANVPVSGATSIEKTAEPNTYTLGTYTHGMYLEQYGCCELAGTGTVLRVSDVCGQMFISPTDDFGGGWTMAFTDVTGPTITFEFTGFFLGTLQGTMTRDDGLDWGTDIIPN